MWGFELDSSQQSAARETGEANQGTTTTEKPNPAPSKIQSSEKFHRDIPSTPVFAYHTSAKKANVPGPTIDANAWLETYIRWENHLPQRHVFPLIDYSLDIARPKYGGVPTVVHVHGGINEPESDGHSHGWFTSGFK
ncbi:hypothetical protein O6H91_19G085900 [Diphasiastrum complanatum]|uniref:Uncharacterized protein n=1 Tax=Diphasiastrum complanatum TaxID=34168 RepID=A0ACC2AX93_DIPCM|nr:hypothetical protein O6H91_19G085900 [Diphasiastrum complanatum]